MKNKKIIIALASVAMIAVVAIGGTLAYFTDSDNVNDTVSLGKVNISITERTTDTDASVQKDESGIVTGIKYTGIMPGDIISKEPIVTVENDSKDAYIRAKIEIAGVDGAYSQEDGLQEYLSHVTYNTEACGWVLGNDGYYYYQNIVNSTDNNQISVFTETYIPTSWGAEIRNKSFEVKINAEAVQSEYMNPIRDNNNKIIGWNN